MAPDHAAIALTDVSVAFGERRVLDGLDLEIPRGEITAIVGRSGSGKSVLLKTMLGLIKPDRGRVVVLGRDLGAVSELELLELRKRMAMVFQSYALLDALTVESNVAFPLVQASAVPPVEIARRSRELLATLGLSGSEHLLPAALSGGMRKRVSLARALIGQPELVLFDEPTTGLDPLMVQSVDELIADASRRRGLTSVIVTHDLASIQRLAHHVAFLDGGKIIFFGSYDELARSDLPPIRAFLDGAATEITPGVDRAAADAPPVVELIGVCKQFGERAVLRGIDLAVRPRQTMVLLGASGSGKSVLIKHILGLLRPDTGEVRVFGKNLATSSARELDEVRTRIGLVFQHAALLDWLSVEDNVGFPLLERRRLPRAETRERVDAILARLGIADLRHWMPGELSIGQRKRVGIARAVVTEPELVIYDEPTTGQDPRLTHEIDELIRELQAQLAITSIVVSHDLESAFRIADSIAILHEGTIIARGTPAEVRASEIHYVRRFLAAASAPEPARKPRAA